VITILLNAETITGRGEYFIKENILLLTLWKCQVDADGLAYGVKGEFGFNAPHLSVGVGNKREIENDSFINGKAETCNGEKDSKKVDLSLG